MIKDAMRGCNDNHAKKAESELNESSKRQIRWKTWGICPLSGQWAESPTRVAMAQGAVVSGGAPVAYKRGNRTCNLLPQTANFIADKKALKRCKHETKYMVVQTAYP